MVVMLFDVQDDYSKSLGYLNLFFFSDGQAAVVKTSSI